MFEYGNVSISGKRGRGKDMLQANVIVRRKRPYISNVDYGGQYLPFDYDKINVSSNDFNDFMQGTLKPYVFPYDDETDIYISDAGLYFPAHYCNELNKHYKSLPTFFALSRQLGLCNVHVNSQALPRVWDKIREQSDQYIVCLGCKVILGYVFMRIGIFERYESAVNVQPKLRLPRPLFEGKREKLARRTAEEQYRAQHGEIKYKMLIFKNKSEYDTRYFKKLLEGKENVKK